MKDLDTNQDISIVSGCDIDPALLFEFYDQIYPERKEFLRKHWKWFNRTAYLAKKIPFVVIQNNKVIAHAGMMGGDFTYNGNAILTSWFTDLAVLYEHQGKGLGITLTKKWMEVGDIQLAVFCNERSIALFKKLGWTQITNSYLHVNITAPFSHPRLAKKNTRIFTRSAEHALLPHNDLILQKVRI